MNEKERWLRNELSLLGGIVGVLVAVGLTLSFHIESDRIFAMLSLLGLCMGGMIGYWMAPKVNALQFHEGLVFCVARSASTGTVLILADDPLSAVWNVGAAPSGPMAANLVSLIKSSVSVARDKVRLLAVGITPPHPAQPAIKHDHTC